MKKSWIVLVALFVAIVAVAAQVAAQDTSTEPSGVVRVGSWESGDALTPWNNAIANFESEHPNIDVQLEAVPQEYGTKLLAQFASGSAPDVFMTGDGDVATFQSLGAVENLDPYIDGDAGFDRGVLYPAVAAFGEVAGSTYYLTKDYSPLVLYYNKTQFDDAGLDTLTSDWTWDDLLSAAQKLTIDANGNDATSPDFDASNIQRWGMQIPDGWGDVVWTRGILPLIYQNGGELIASDGSTLDGSMNSESTVSALQWYVDLFNKYHVSPTHDEVASYAGVDMFQSGLVSMQWTGVWPLLGYKADDTMNFGTSGLPTGPAGNANVLCWSGFAMYSGSQNKDAAWEFLKYIGAGEGAAEFANYALTPVISVAESQGLTEDQYYAPVMADLASVLPLPESTSPYWNECGNTAFADHLTNVFAGSETVQEAADAAVAQGDQCIAEKVAEEASTASS